MGLVHYIHHYYPALLFSSMLSAVLLDYITLSLARLAPSSLASPLVHTCLAATLATCCYTFYMFSDLAYGMEGEYAREANSTKHHQVLTSYLLRQSYSKTQFIFC